MDIQQRSNCLWCQAPPTCVFSFFHVWVPLGKIWVNIDILFAPGTGGGGPWISSRWRAGRITLWTDFSHKKIWAPPVMQIQMLAQFEHEIAYLMHLSSSSWDMMLVGRSWCMSRNLCTEFCVNRDFQASRASLTSLDSTRNIGLEPTCSLVSA